MPKAKKRKMAKRKASGRVKLSGFSRFSSRRSLIAIAAVAVVGGAALFFANAATQTSSYQSILCPIRPAGQGGSAISAGDLNHYETGDFTNGPGAVRPGRRHLGLDITNHPHEIVEAVVSGTIAFADQKSGYGGTVILHETGYDITDVFNHQGHEFLYGHLNRIDVHSGQSVRAGDQLGTIAVQGDPGAGNEQGTALHFETWTPQVDYAFPAADGHAPAYNFGDSTVLYGNHDGGPWIRSSDYNLEPLSFIKPCETRLSKYINIVRTEPRPGVMSAFSIGATFYIDGVKHVSNSYFPGDFDKILNMNLNAYNVPGTVCHPDSTGQCSPGHGYWQGNFIQHSATASYAVCTPYGTTCDPPFIKMGKVDPRTIQNMTISVSYVFNGYVHHAQTNIFTGSDQWNRTANLCLNGQNGTWTPYQSSGYWQVHLSTTCTRY